MEAVTLRVRGVSRRYGTVRALDGVNLDLPAGRTVALLGPSGCGKSTLLRVLAGLEAPDEGTVRLDDRDLSGVPPQRRGVGMVFQDFALFPHLDVVGNVAFGLVEQRWSREAREARVAELLALVGLTGLERRRPHALSGGQQQRVALARALAPRPSLVLLDEPLSNLDRALREELSHELATLLGALDLRALHVTHDQREAFTLADQVALMREGRIVQTGTPHEVREAPRSTWVAAFLGLREIVVEGMARALGFAGPVLLRVERFTPDSNGRVFNVRGVRLLEEDVELALRTADWPFDVRWRARPRELPAGVPRVGDEVRLRVPEDAWMPLGVFA